MNYNLRFRLIVFTALVLGGALTLSSKQFPEAYRNYVQFTGLILGFCGLTLVVFMNFGKENDAGNWQTAPPASRNKRDSRPDPGPGLSSSPPPRPRNLIDAYRTDASFRRMIWLHFGLMAAGIISAIPFSNTTFADPSAWLGVPGLLLCLGAWVTLIFRIDRYLKKDRPDEYAHIPIHFRRIKKISTYGALLLLPLCSYFGRPYTENLLSEVAFFSLFIPLSGLLALAVAWFLPARIPGMPEGMFRLEFQLVIWVLFFLFFLAGAGAINGGLATEKRRTEALWVVKKRENHRKKQSLLLHVNGKARKFRPTRQEWETIREQDTVTVVIRRGALGFDFIEKFGVK